jgi:hypothetical protein
MLLLLPILLGCDAYFRVSQPVDVRLTNALDNAPLVGANISSPDQSRTDTNGPTVTTDSAGRAKVDVRHGFILSGISGWFDNPDRDRLTGTQCTFNILSGTEHEKLTVKVQPNAQTTAHKFAISVVSVGPTTQLHDADPAK